LSTRPPFVKSSGKYDVKILRLEIEGFRSLRKVCWEPGGLSLLIGPNGSGKSNLLGVLELLVCSAAGGLGRYVQQEGGIEPLLWDGQADSIRVVVTASPLPPYEDVKSDSLTYDLTLARLKKTSAYRIEAEALENRCEKNRRKAAEAFVLLKRDPRRAMIYDMNRQAIDVRPAVVPEQETLLSSNQGPFSVNPFVTGFREQMAAWRIYQSFHTERDAAIRSPVVARVETQVEDNGQNLIAVLHTLYTESREFKRDLNLAMQAAFGEDFDRLEFPPAADQRVQLRVHWKSLNRGQPAADLPDGMLRFLYLMAILANPSPPPLIGIDEPETGLNPSMLPIIAEFAVEASKRTQLVFSTHSPEFLDAFRDTVPTTTVLEWRDGETDLTTLSGETLAYWLKRYTLGELYRSNELEAMR
jgi:predicted ATPase